MKTVRPRLTDEQKSVILASLRYGASNRAIARDLAVDEKTIRRFRASLDVTEKHGREETLGQSHLSNNAVKRFIAVSDIHWPYVHKPTIKLILSLLGDIQFDGFVFLGDQFDNSVISHHNKGKNLLKPRGSYYAEETSFDKEFLRPVEQLIGDGKKIWIKGNHDHWETQYVEEFPELEGKIERDISLKLEERGWEVVECGKSYTYGKLTYLHGETLTGAQHAKKALEVFCTNVLYGHFHSPQSATKVLPHNQTQKWSAWCSPIAGDCNPYYMRNKPSGWVNGFTLIEYTRNGNFNLYPIITSGNEIAYGGKIYKA